MFSNSLILRQHTTVLKEQYQNRVNNQHTCETYTPSHESSKKIVRITSSARPWSRLRLFFINFVFFLSCVSFSDETPSETTKISLQDQCVSDLLSLPGPANKKWTSEACLKVRQLDDCVSVQTKPIYHYDKNSKEQNPKKILVLSLIHGDEIPAGSVGRYWMERLENIDPRNSWRVIPILNPDGLLKKTRTNANDIDLNRNFPTRDWDSLAIKLWKEKLASNPRRNPGVMAGSEPEVKCVLKHIEDFEPDFVVSIHTPLKVLDFDGPKVKPPAFSALPWKSLGHYPGSLGRYLWFERGTPVLTTELAPGEPKDYSPFEKLQDVIGQLVKLEIKK